MNINIVTEQLQLFSSTQQPMQNAAYHS